MIIEFGHFALALATVIFAAAGALGFAGVWRNNARIVEASVSGVRVGFAVVLIAFAALIHAHVTSDFSALNVFMNSHSLVPLLYKFSGAWGNHEGSMLLWLLMLAGYGAALAVFPRTMEPRFRARLMTVMGLAAFIFALFILFTSNPFARILPAPHEGQDLNPLLQDPGLAFHPPFLYLGYVGFVAAFAFSIAGLWQGFVDRTWAKQLRPYVLLPWSALTLGIAMGSWWAYYELGWGGFWFWDPVENASLMPWLFGTALLHSVSVTEKRDALRLWTILLGILTFGFSLLGTFLVRSGVITSVHAFASDPSRGMFVLVMMVLAMGGGLALFAARGNAIRSNAIFAPVSREGFLLINNLFLASAAATIFIGTLYPLFLDVLKGQTISVGPPYYHATFAPIMAPVIIAMGIAPLLRWRRDEMKRISGVFFMVLAIAMAIGFSAYEIYGARPLAGIVAFALGGFLIAGSVADALRRRSADRWPGWYIGMLTAHIGLGIMILGIGGAAFMKEKTLLMKIGAEEVFEGYAFQLKKVDWLKGPNYATMRGEFLVYRGSEFVTRLAPERRSYVASDMTTTEAAISPTIFRDLYVTIGDKRDDSYTVMLQVHPLQIWVWGGAMLMSIGGVLSVLMRRKAAP